MSNMFGSLYIGNSGLKSANNSINVVANNLANVNTEGYVRQQVLFSDSEYNSYSTASTSSMQYGLGVKIADVVHARDVFLDKSYRSESGRAAFYNTSYSAITEVEDILQETEGEAFSESINDLWEAFQEFEKDPSDTVNQNLVIQRASLFLSRSDAVYTSLKQYQSTLNNQIKDDVDRINELGEIIRDCNVQIQKIEAGGVETAMQLRDTRDAALDELGKLANISYQEDAVGCVYVKVENVDFVDLDSVYEIGMYQDKVSGFYTPYWPQLSDLSNDDMREVFRTYNISSERRNDVGEVKSLLLARGDDAYTYMDMIGLDSDEYSKGLGSSVVTNTQAEIDTLLHSVMTGINDLISPLKEFGGADTIVHDKNGKEYTLTAETKICDTENCARGADGEVPPEELFTRIGCDRYTEVTDADGNTYYLYNEEDYSDSSKCYTIANVRINDALIEDESRLAHMTSDGAVAYDYAENLANLWEEPLLSLNPGDTTPCSFTDFYTKLTGELSNKGSVCNTTGETLDNTVEGIEYQRQQIIGVSSDEELSNMIQYQSAYNASSRYISVISEMIEHILTTLGS